MVINPKNVFVHESGHAVVGVALGYELDDVTIRVDRKTLLPCCGGVIFVNQELIRPFDSIVIRMAGKGAEEAICPPISERNGDKDQNDIDLVLGKLKLKEPDLSAYLADAESKSEAVILANFNVIVRMADEIANIVVRQRSAIPDLYSIPCLHYLRHELQKVSPAVETAG